MPTYTITGIEPNTSSSMEEYVLSITTDDKRVLKMEGCVSGGPCGITSATKPYRVTLPKRCSGRTATVSATFGSGPNQCVTPEFTYTFPPFIIDVSFSAGKCTIQGNHFGGEKGTVKIGDNELKVVSWEPTKIVCILPFSVPARGTIGFSLTVDGLTSDRNVQIPALAMVGPGDTSIGKKMLIMANFSRRGSNRFR